MAQIEKMYGKGSIMRFGDRTSLDVDYIPTGSLALDVALGIGGLPKGRIIEIYGPSPPVKPPWHFMWWQRRRSGAAKWRLWMPSMRWILPMPGRWGVKVEDMLISQPDTGEQALEITEALVRSGAIDVIVVDSVGCPGAPGRN